MASNESSSKSNNHSTSKKKIEKANTKWSIDNSSALRKKTGDFIKSPTFKSKTDDKVKWSLVLYPKGYEDKSSDYISIYLQLEEVDNIDVTTMWNFYVINQEDEEKIRNFQKYNLVRPQNSLVTQNF
uniref:MATH domain-containing protein n=1 Tax=Strongyloides venezuelensis TaxID=75913 RepID=A0A0K0F521_STRVS